MLPGFTRFMLPPIPAQYRVGMFRAWLLARPERVVVAFGHSTFFKEFAQLSVRMANCEVKLLKV